MEVGVGEEMNTIAIAQCFVGLGGMVLLKYVGEAKKKNSGEGSITLTKAESSQEILS